MAKSRLKTSSLALVFFLVLLVANVAITSVSAAGLSVGLPGTNPSTPSPTPQPQSQQTQPTPTQQTPTSQQQQPSSPPSPTQTSDNQNHQPSQQPAPNPTDNNNTPPAQAASQAPEGSKSTVVTGDNNVVYTTLTSYSSFLPVPTGVPSSATAANSNSGGSDSSSNVVVPAIVVGSVVVAAALGIWIFRKWKLSPSRDFKEKIQPIDFSPSAAREDSVFLRELNEP